jgi:hypothetical protein
MTGGPKQPVNKIRVYLRTTPLQESTPPPHLPTVFLCVFAHESAGQRIVSVTISLCFQFFFLERTFVPGKSGGSCLEKDTLVGGGIV